MSMKGWSFKAWLKGNKEAAKLVVAAVAGLYVPADPGVKALVGAIVKLILDSIDYYAKSK